MMQDPQLDIASRLLIGLIGQNRSRVLAERMDDIRHATEVAAELIRQNQPRGPAQLEHTLKPRPAFKVREKVVDRDAVSLLGLLKAKRAEKAAEKPASSTSKKPTLH